MSVLYLNKCTLSSHFSDILVEASWQILDGWKIGSFFNDSRLVSVDVIKQLVSRAPAGDDCCYSNESVLQTNALECTKKNIVESVPY